jgi:shikimate kinase
MLIFLIGFMGAGKSHWGKIWSAECGWPFYDLDALIEGKTQQSIPAIFEEKGEPYFRQMEASVLRGLPVHKKGIVACGGGTPCFHDNIIWMNDNGVTVYLSATRETLANNILKDKAKRPMLKHTGNDQLLSFIEKKLAERKGYYESARMELPVTSLNNHSIHQVIQL